MAALTAIFSVCCEFSAFCLILEFISSMEEDTSSATEACSVAPWDICSVLELMAWAAAVTFMAEF